MSLINVTLDLRRIATALESIAESLLLLRPAPLPTSISAPYVAQLSDLQQIDPARDQEQGEKLAALAESMGLEPGSEAFELAMQGYNEDTRKFYGKEESDAEWEKLFKASDRKPATP